jgi:outer membrane protein TolC
MQTHLPEFRNPATGKAAYTCNNRVWILILFLLSLIFAFPNAFAKQDTAQRPGQPEVLTVDDAVKIALANNRTLKIVSLNVDVHKEKLAADKTKRLPSFNSYIFGSQLLTPISYTIPAGQFGTYPAPIGPIPATTNYITTPAHPTALIALTASQPLLSLYRINLYLRGQRLSIQQAVEQLREQRLTVIDQVQQAYYKVMQIENQIDSLNASIKQYKELDRITLEYVSQQVALKSENLEVEAKLAHEQLNLLKAQDKLETAKETLNDLLGRDLKTPIRTAAVSPISAIEQNLETAEATALEHNPQIAEAEIDVQKATNARQLAKSQYIPDLNVSIQYTSPFGYDFVPLNVANAGFEFRWEPWEWGRRKHEVEEKTINIEQSRLKLDNTKSQLLINVGDSFRSLQEARAAVAVAQAKQEASREKLREVTLQYEQKTALLRDVLQQQAALESADSEYNNAVAEFWSAKATFQKAIGEE